MRKWQFFALRILIAAMICTITPMVFAAHWASLGPEGGDTRAFAYDPQNPDRVFMGTMAGKLFLSNDGGANWTRIAHLGSDDSYVLDKIAIDPTDTKIIYVAAWGVGNVGGDLFRSKDGGKSWQTIDALHGKSLRALALANTDPKTIVVGALDGVFRSKDGGDSWTQITPLNHNEMKNFESVAIDPTNPDIIYAGTWHLPWKTIDGGANWKNIKNGVIDDSDVFSIIIDPKNPQVVYISACSGIYKSENGAELFHKIQGMPFTARRTHVLKMDPTNSEVVYAGTTEGLWKTIDGGKSFHLMTSPSVVVNDIYLDPRNTSRLLLTTDRGGVLQSENAGTTFSASNRGFAHRQVGSLLLDNNDSSTLYAGIINDKEFGGVFVSHDNGLHWSQMSSGLGGRDIFVLRQTPDGALLAGTNRGVFTSSKDASGWRPLNVMIKETTTTKRVLRPAKAKLKPVAQMVSTTKVERSEFTTRVNDIAFANNVWYAAATNGLFSSANRGQSWKGGTIAGQSDFVAVHTQQSMVAAASHTGVVVSVDGGAHWYAANVPYFITGIHDLAVDGENTLWIATHMGVFRSTDSGDNWEHVLNGLPSTNVDSVSYDEEGKRLLVSSTTTTTVYESKDGGRKWHSSGHLGWEVRSVTAGRGKLFVTTAYDGVVAPSETISNDSSNTASVAGTPSSQ
ncbi:MAG TPA: YCF48-related protein [Terriglobales bacterium]|nr:YCF48-related protein [Terriglobales bacterium]